MAVGLFTLFQVTADSRWYDEGKRLTDSMVELFHDGDGFYSPGTDATNLIARPKDFYDNPLPSANSLAAEALTVLSAFTGEADSHIEGITRGAARLLERYPTAAAHLLGVLVTATSGIKQVAIVGSREHRRPLEQTLWESYRPDCVLAPGDENSPIPLLQERGTAGSDAAAHVCHDFVCALPVTTASALRSALQEPFDST
jgi:hypothetical protein